MKSARSSFFFTLFFVLLSFVTLSQKGKDGDYTVTGANVILNTYTSLTTDASATATSITVANNSMTGGVFSGALQAGDLILIIQMQGASMDINTTPAAVWGGNYTVPNSYFNVAWGASPESWGGVTNYGNAGRFEKREVLSVSGGNTINLTCGLINSYTASGRVQIVRIPRFNNLTVSAGNSIVPTLWNGSTGGIVALEVESVLDIGAGATISASAAGFRGGALDPSSYPAGGGATATRPLGSFEQLEGSEKGEGIGGFYTEYDALYSRYGIGAPANGGGGGGYQNTGGGGGSNVVSGTYTGKGTPIGYPAVWNLESAGFGGSTSGGGGRGGYALSQSDQNELVVGPNNAAWSGDDRKSNGGYGGHPLPFNTSLVFFGGGGGAGDQDGGQGGAGGRGGGAVFISSYGTITGTGTIEARGGNGQKSNPFNLTPSSGTPRRGNDGAGGGGAGGAIHMENRNTIPATILLNVRGGDGGNHDLSLYVPPFPPPTSSEAAGPGGSGSGGMVVYANGAAPNRNLLAGTPGSTNSAHMVNFPPNGATSGSNGISLPATVAFHDITAVSPTICSGSTANLSATVFGTLPGGGPLQWYTVPVGGVSVGSGTTFTTPALTATTTYYVGSCPGTFRVPVVVTVTPPDNSSFNYSAASFCQSGLDPTPTITGLAGGTFTSSPAGLSINATTGAIDLSASTLGVYTVTYTTAGPCPTSTNQSVTITATTNANFSYGAASYCVSSADPTPTVVTSGGTFTSSPAGLSINATTGVIDVSASTLGAYTATYSIGGACPNSSSQSVTITALDDASFNYSAASYCTSAADPTPTITGLAGGTFTSSPAGLSINASTGTIDLSASTIGVYTITYTTGGSCSNSSNVSMSVTALDDASFAYSSSSYCVSGTDPTPTPVVTGGTYSSSPAGLSINASTGAIDLSASTPGVYTVTYTTVGACSNSSNQSVTITTLDDASFAYSATSYCQNAVDPTPTIAGASGGTFTSSPAGLSINASTGAIDVSASTAGVYTVTYTTAGTCSNSSNVSVTINALDDASFSYSAAAYCVNSVDPTPTITGQAGGTFTSSPAGLSINATTGIIDVSASTVGVYTVTYTTAGSCPNSSNVSVTINTLDDASFSYSAASYCLSATDPSPTITGLAGGTFTSSPAGLSINASTGVIDVSASTAGAYTVTYTTGGSCSNSSNVSVTIDALDDASFSYSAASYCVNATDPTPTITGLSGGTFTSSPAGLSINASTGMIDVSASTSGVYTVTYTTSGSCPNSSNISITINDLDNASFSYSAASYCSNAADPSPTITGLAGGTFSSSPAGLSMNASTGAIDVSASTTGAYTITYTTAGSCTNTSSVSVTINALDNASFSYSAASYCGSGSDPSPTITGLAGGTFSSTPAGLSMNGVTGQIDVSASTPGSYTITYTTAGTCPNTSNQSVTVIATDDPTFTLTAACGGATANVTGTPGGTFSFTVLPTDGAIINPTTGEITNASSNGTYAVTYTTNGSCAASLNQNVTTLPSPMIDPIADQTACDQFILPIITGTNLSGTEAYYSDSQLAGGTMLVGSLTNSQTVYVYDSNMGCTDEISFNVTVNTTDDASFTLTDFCEGSINGATITGVTGGTFDFVSPTTDGSTINSATGEITNGVGGTTYSIIYTTNGVCPNNSTQSVDVYEIPSAPVVSADQTYCAGEALANMTATPGMGGTINWYLVSNSGTSVATGPTFKPKDDLGVTFYYATETVNGCESAESTVMITIESCDIIVPTAFTPNGDGAHDDWEIPNLDVTFPNNVVKVYNRWGNLLFESKKGNYEANRWDGKYKDELLPVGSYYFIIELNDDKTDDKTGTVSILLDQRNNINWQHYARQILETEGKIITSDVRVAFQSKCDEMREEQGRQLHVSHLGTFSQDLVISLSQDIEDLLVSIGDHRLVIKRMFSILIEGLQNVRIHGEIDPSSHQQLGYLILASSDQNYKVIMANITTESDKEKITKFIDKINNYSTAELKDTYRSVLANEFLSQKGGAGLGFITTRMKSGNSLGTEFVDLNDGYVLFSLEVTLDRLPKEQFMLKVAFHEDYIHPLPAGHRFPMEKYELLPKQLVHEGTLDIEHFFTPLPCDFSLLGSVHDSDYLDQLFRLEISPRAQRKTGFIHTSSLIERESKIMEGTRMCAEYALTYGAAMNIAGGTHHAYTNRGEGFCLMNDQAIAAKWLLQNNLSQRILIVDLDVHQGNGTAQIFANSDEVFTFSMHGKNNYPLHKEQSHCDIELPDGIGDAEYLTLLEKHLSETIENFSPDFMFFQSGVDVLETDKLGKLALSIEGCKTRDQFVFKKVKELNIPVVCSMGGGYSPDIKQIIEAHANTFREVQNFLF